MFRATVLTAILALSGAVAHAEKHGETAVEATVAPLATPVFDASPSEDWSGFYAGGQLSVGDADDGTADLDADGFGIHAGYMWDTGSFVFGGELDYDAFDTDDGGPDLDVVRLKAVAGYDLGNFLPYITAGAANVDVDNSDLEDTIGFYGLGGSYQVNDTFRVGAEYLIHEGDDFDGGGADLDLDTFSLRGSFTF